MRQYEGVVKVGSVWLELFVVGYLKEWMDEDSDV